MRKNNQERHSSLVVRVNKDCVKALGQGVGLKSFRQSPPTSIHKWRHHFAPATQWEGEWDSTECFYSRRLENHSQMAILLYTSEWKLCKRPAGQRLHWERREKRIHDQSITPSVVKPLSEVSFGLMGWGEVK